MEDIYQISCLTWVKRGVASSNPRKAKLDETRVKRFIADCKQATSDEEEDAPSHSQSKRKSKLAKPVDEVDERIMNDYNLNDYSDDDSKGDQNDSDDGSFGMSNLAVYTDDKQDPYLTKDDDDDDDDDDTIPNDSNLIVAGKVDDGFFSLEVWVYNELLGNEGLYCHHEYILPSCPIAVEWVGGIEGKNLAAVGCLDGSIGLWDLDVMDNLDPAYYFKGVKSKKRKTPRAKKLKTEAKDQSGHSKAVLSLSWNELQGNILASSSADHTIGLWDLNSIPQCCFIDDLHSKEINSIQWHPFEAQTLLTGSSDETVKVFDCRSSRSSAKSWKMSAGVEKVLWHNSSPFYFFAGLSTGYINYVDVRMDKPVFEIDAHSPGDVTDLAVCHSAPNCLLSSSGKGAVKVWNTSSESKSVSTKNFKIGRVYCLSTCPDSSKPIFAVGGDNEMKVYNLAKDGKAAEAFGWTFEGKVDTKTDEKPKSEKKVKTKKVKTLANQKEDEDDDLENEAESEKLKKVEKKKAKERIGEKKKKSKKLKEETNTADD